MFTFTCVHYLHKHQPKSYNLHFFSFFFVAVLESASLEKILPDAAQNSEAGDVSPCRSPSTPRHLRYRQPGGKAVLCHAQRVSGRCPPTRRSLTHHCYEYHPSLAVVGVRAHPPQQLVNVIKKEWGSFQLFLAVKHDGKTETGIKQRELLLQSGLSHSHNLMFHVYPLAPPPCPVSSIGRELALPRLSCFGLRYCHSSGRT